MMYHRLAALFARYCAAHLYALGQTTPLLGERGQTLGHIDRISLRGQRIEVEGWADTHQIIVSHAGQNCDINPSLARHDVHAKFPHLQHRNPGFVASLPHGTGAVTVTLVQDAQFRIYRMPTPTACSIQLARARLVAPFLRDMGKATPAILHWLVTKDPADRARLKHHLRLATQAPARVMQPLLFLADCLAHMPEKQQAVERARLHPSTLSHRAITIILPVYNALDLLPEVLARVVQNTDLPWRLILIEDASTDPALRPYLRAWALAQNNAVAGHVTLLENTENQGFIRSVNAGLTLAIGHGDHVVLLNSDAFLPPAWATRLMRPFLAHDRVATVTPMSNDAEIFSAPVLGQRMPLLPGEADAIDAIAAKMHPDAALADAPTGVGFCMAMSIDYLRKIPQLDTVFGRGYGEEVDWCQKARAIGGRHLGLANLFVEHRGSVSFGTAEKQHLVARNNAIISRKYPSYDNDVQRFMADDPLAGPRLALAIALAQARAKSAIPIYLAHNMGGGAEDYLLQRIANTWPEPALVLRVGTAQRWQLELHSRNGIARGSTDDYILIQRLLNPVERRRIVYSCGVGDPHPFDLPEKLLALHRGPQDSIEMLIHDYLPISPSYNLLNSKGRYCGLPDPTQTDPAHSARGPQATLVGLADWQAEWGKLIAKANDITVFSQSSGRIFSAAYPTAVAKLRLAPHTLLFDVPRLPAANLGTQRVIGVLGNIGHQKGAGVLQDLSCRLAHMGTASLVVFGQLDPNYVLAPPAKVHGGYDRRDIAALAARYGITDWLIPSIWPETFSYTTHEAIATGLAVWCFDLGAQADAVRRSARGGVLPIPGGAPDMDALVTALLPPVASPDSLAA